jgi:hypothetical protein
MGKPAQEINQDLTVRKAIRLDLTGIRARVLASGTTHADDDETIN